MPSRAAISKSTARAAMASRTVSTVFALVVRDVGQELGHPAHLVQRRRRVDEQRRVGLQHPLQALQHRAPLGPGLGVRGGELAAVGEARLHGGIAVAVEHRHLEPAVEELVGGRQAGHAGADHGNRGHRVHSQGSGRLAAAVPPPCLGPESFTRDAGLSPSVGLVGPLSGVLRPCRSLDLRVSGAVAPSAAGHPAFSRHSLYVSVAYLLRAIRARRKFRLRAG